MPANVRSDFKKSSGNLTFYEKVTGGGASVNYGYDTVGLDVKFFGATTSSSMLWDESADKLIFNGSDLNLQDDDILEFGDSADVSMTFNSTRTALTTAPAGNWVAPEGIPDRYRLVWVAGQRGKPSLNADILSATEATRMIVDPLFEVLGTNASSDDVTFYAEGGIQLQTDGADGDSVILLPHLDANLSPWTQVTWGTDKEVRWECDISTAANITNAIVWAGLKLTNTATTATDADQVFFRYEDDVNSGKWQAVDSIGGTDTATDSGVTVAVSTNYHLVIDIASDRTAQFYINGTLVKTSSALTDAIDLIPYIGVEADGAAAAKTLYVHGQAISRTKG